MLIEIFFASIIFLKIVHFINHLFKIFLGFRFAGGRVMKNYIIW
ncbi:unnamed protein product [Paramecium sonneborni]|uniref:Uncharacterized protein n=1 Tax=Paramecium sonneborni TaxID=65129 RepID=A0A8S1RLW1_9CILI|nr:unnamed protein product [Paramecium sonneborni]